MIVLNSIEMKRSQLAFIILIVSCLVTTAFEKPGYIKGAYHLPKQSRKEIMGQLKLLIEYERTGQYDAQYDLYDKEIVRRTGMTKEDYVQRQKQRAANIGVIQSINLEQVNRFDENHVGISGTAKMLNKNQKVFRSIAIVATLQDGQWYFGFGFPET